ncbi:S-type pyocin domain-containing protein [Streptomyces sp. NPDC047017]|uniref:S-type pyocin domain-containing protein n=1 Tax=Streptomyces sp. NPDC047017 TaxID=3155024 RepID=UPI0033CBC756
MRPEENSSTADVIPFRRPQEAAEPVGSRPAAPDAGHEADTPPATVLRADRGVINTGTVHGGQHVTAIELPGHFGGGADGDI